MTKENSTEIVFVVDRSGSMARIASTMRAGFAKLIEEQLTVPGECLVTMARFDDSYELVYERLSLGLVPPLDLEPRGSTALFDAVGRTINAVGARLARTPESARPSRVLFVIVTDGHENASREFTRAQVAEMVKHQQNTYSWSFMFLGAARDAVLQAGELGIPAAHVMNFQANAVGASALNSGLSGALRSYRGATNKKDMDEAIGSIQAQYDASVSNANSPK